MPAISVMATGLARSSRHLSTEYTLFLVLFINLYKNGEVNKNPTRTSEPTQGLRAGGEPDKEWESDQEEVSLSLVLPI